MARRSSGSTRLAIEGGTPVRGKPFPARLLFAQAEKRAVMRLFDKAIKEGNQVLGYNGPEEEGYCKEFAKLLGGGYADGVNSGTNALYVALRALELEPFTEVIVPPISDPGGIMPVALCNCIPVPADAAPGSYNVGAEQIAERITRRTRAIVVAHISGLPCDMGPIMRLARSKGIPVIEDCAQTHGATYKGKPVGSLGDISVFSTMFGKHHASAGQGGLVFTRSEETYWRIRRCADRGKRFGLDPGDGNVVAALNCNMDELHSCIGRVQLAKLPKIVRKRRAIAQQIAAGCRESLKTVRVVEELPGCEGVYWFLFVRLALDRIRVDKAAFVAALAHEGIPVSADYWACPTRMEWHRKHRVFGTSGMPWSRPGQKRVRPPEYALPNIEATDACNFRISIHEGYTRKDASNIVSALRKVEKAYRK